MLQSHHYAKTTSAAVFGSMREELIHATRRTETGLLNLADASSTELGLDRGREVGVNTAVNTPNDASADGAGGCDLISDIRSHLVTTGADGGSNTGPDIGRIASQTARHGTDGSLNDAGHDTTPSRMCHPSHTAHRIE
jgi:hypothetical protein